MPLYRYWDNLQAVIWPRFEQIFRMNIQSIQECDPTKFPKETGPHYVSYRFYFEIFQILSGVPFVDNSTVC